MRRRAERHQVGQGWEERALVAVRRAVLPLALGVVTAKRTLLGWLHAEGLEKLAELLQAEAEGLAGPKKKHQVEREANHWGTAPAELIFGGRRIRVQRPRVRRVGGGELVLPSVAEFRERDPLDETTLGQILLGVSTRGFDRSVPAAPPAVTSRGASKSAASRGLMRAMKARLGERLSERLDEFRLAVLMIDGIEIGGQTIVVALGIDWGGRKRVLGLAQGATENAAVCTALLTGLQERGLKVEEKILCVLDGGKGLRKAVADVFGDLARVQRCQLHKRRNVAAHLPQHLQRSVGRTMREAYAAKSATLARQRLQRLASWLERQGHTGAARSLREGLEETLTVLKLRLSETLRKTLSSTNPIENTIGSIRRVTRNVKRWRGGRMAERWVAVALLEAERGFKRIKGYRDLSRLREALAQLALDEETKAA